LEKFTIHVFSDSYGESGEQVSKCALSQFGFGEYDIIRHSHVNTMDALKEELKILDGVQNILVVHTMINLKLVESLHEFCKENNLKHVDLLNPLVNAIAEHTKKTPKRESGIYKKLDDKYFRRIEAIEFAVKYDDGKDARGIHEADLILLGISRTSKTPLSIYLGNKKHIKVINIPLVPEVEVPKEIFKVSKKKIIGLTNSIEMLNKIREERVKTIGFKEGSAYSSLGRIIEEMDYAENIIKKIGCPVVDVSQKAIEETSEIILGIMKENGFKIVY
jgi:regulator of PEP synthase PpsR (kinase-PPPase family)